MRAQSPGGPTAPQRWQLARFDCDGRVENVRGTALGEGAETSPLAQGGTCDACTRHVLSATTLLGIVALTGCETEPWPDIECRNEVTTTLVITRHLSELDGAAIELCREDACVQGVLAFRADSNESDEKINPRSSASSRVTTAVSAPSLRTGQA